MQVLYCVPLSFVKRKRKKKVSYRYKRVKEGLFSMNALLDFVSHYSLSLSLSSVTPAGDLLV